MRLFVTSLIAVATCDSGSLGEVIRVPEDAQTIQAGLDSLHDGDTVLVAAGVYRESLVAPSLHFSLFGDPDSTGSARPEVDIASMVGSDTLPCLLLPEGSRCEINDFVFRHGRMGIYSWSDRVTMLRCDLDSSSWGFYQTWNGGMDSAVYYLIECVIRDHSVQGVHVIDYPVIAQGCSFPSGNGFNLCSVGRGSQITFCSFGSNTEGGLLVVKAEDALVSDCRFGPGSVVAGYQLIVAQNNHNTVIRNNLFAGNTVGQGAVLVKVFGPQVFFLEQNLFANNLVLEDHGTCIQVDRDGRNEPTWGGTIAGNLFVNCFGRNVGANAIEADGDLMLFENRFVESEPDEDGLPEILITRGAGSVMRNNRFDHTGVALRGPWMDAEMNWWGDASGPYHETLNPTGRGDSIVGEVDFDPWLSDTLRSNEPPTWIPTKTELISYPNPFNATARLKLSVAKPGEYQIELFDLSGRLTEEIWRGTVVLDREVSFTAGNLPSGVYFARASSVVPNISVATTKMILIR